MADGSVIFDTGLDLNGFRQDAARLLQLATTSALTLETTMSHIDTGMDGVSDGAARAGGGISAFKAAAVPALQAVATAGAAIGAALVAGGTYAVKLASDLAEVQNVVDTTFGENASAVNDFAKSAGTAFGMSELQAKQFNGTMGAMLKSMQLSDDEVLNMSTSMAGLAGDFASFYNLDPQEAFDKIRSGISGETEPLKQLGINMSVANLEAYALSEGISKAYSEMTQAEQATLRYNYLMSVSADAQGDFSKTSDSLANQLRIVKLNASDVASAIGQDLIPMVTEGVGTINDMVSRLGSAYETDGFDGLVSELGTILGEIVTMITDAAPEVIEAGMSLINNLLTSIASNGAKIGSSAAEIVAKLVQGITDTIPIIIGAAETIIGGLVKGIGENLPELIPAIVDMLMGIVDTVTDNLPLIIDAAITLFDGLLQGLNKAMPKIIDAIPQIIMKIAQAFTEGIGQLIIAATEMSEQTSGAMTGKMGEPGQWNTLGTDIASALMAGIMLGLEELGPVWEAYWKKKGSEIYFKNPFTGEEQGISDEKRAEQTEADTRNADAEALLEEHNKNTAENAKKQRGQMISDAADGLSVVAGTFADLTSAITTADGEVAAKTEQLQTKWAALQHKYATGVITSDEELYNQKLELLAKYGNKSNTDHNKYYEDIYSMEQGFADDTVKAEEDRISDLKKVQKEHLDYVTKTENQALDNLKESLKEQTSAVEDSVDDATAAYKDQYSELTDMQNQYKDKLLDVGDVFTIKTEKDKNGKDKTTYTVEDMKKQMSEMTDYSKDIGSLKQQGASNALISELSGMGFEEGKNFANYLDNMSNEEFAKINELYTQKQDLADSLSKNLYADELNKIKTDYVDQVKTMLAQLPQDFASYGLQAATALEQSLKFNPENVFDMKGFFDEVNKSISAVELSDTTLQSLAGMDTYAIGVTAGEQFTLGFQSEMDKYTAKLTATVSADQDKVGAKGVASVVPANATTTSSKQEKIVVESTINTTLNVDGQKVATTVTKHQQEADRQKGQ